MFTLNHPSAMLEQNTRMAAQKPPRTAHLDEAHVGDIHGAWGTIREADTAPRKTWLARLLTLLVIMGPGLVTMVGDNDVGGIATYFRGRWECMTPHLDGTDERRRLHMKWNHNLALRRLR